MGENNKVNSFSASQRSRFLNRLKNEVFDLIIVGGGITGAGVARDACQRGLKVALLEMNDFASGTSSRSSKLIHGGIRYLENMEFHLVFEALSERTKLFEMTPHLVHPLRFMIPLYESSRVGMFKMGLGMWLYDALALFQAPEMHENLNATETIERMSILNQQELKGSFVYSDAYMDDDRLVHETLRSAVSEGACCLNYIKADTATYDSENKINGLYVVDQFSQERIHIQGSHIVSSVGPWTDMTAPGLVPDWKKILRPTKGIHLTFRKDRLPLSSAVVMAAEKSNRIVFAIPRHEMVIVGTTDTDYSGDPAQAQVTSEDVTYLLQISNQYFPGARLKPEDIVSSYVGVRPLVKDDSQDEGKTSREHTIISDPRGLTFVAGGKYTTYRLMSQQIVDAALKYFSFEKKALLQKAKTDQPLNAWTDPETYQNSILTANSDLERKLAERYGSEAKLILNKYGFTANYWQIEAYQAIHQTMCYNLTDFYARRVPLMLSEVDHGLQHLDDIAAVFEVELGLSTEQINQQKQNLNSYINRELAWRKSLIGADLKG